MYFIFHVSYFACTLKMEISHTDFHNLFHLKHNHMKYFTILHVNIVFLGLYYYYYNTLATSHVLITLIAVASIL